MGELLNNFRGMIQGQALRYRNVEIPPSAIKAEFTRSAVKSIQNFDSSKGASLGTWVTHNLQLKPKRWIHAHLNTARISEGRVYDVGIYQTTRAQLDEKLGRPPSAIEMSEAMGKPLRHVERLEREIRKDIIGSTMTTDPFEIMPNQAKEVLSFLPYELSDPERTVFEYTMGTNGKPKLNGNQMAAKMGVSPSTISRYKSSIAKKAKKMMV